MRYVFHLGEGEEVAMGGAAPRRWYIVADPVNTGARRLSMGLQRIEPGSRIPLHVHDPEEEILFCFRGAGRIRVGDQEADLRPGTAAFIPPGVWHGVDNTEQEPLWITWTFSPPGYEQTFRAMSRTGIDHPRAPG